MRSVALLLAAASACAATSPGIRLSMSSRGLTYIVDTAVPIIEKKFKTITIPDYHTEKDKIDIDITSGSCDLQNLGQGSLSSDPGQGVAFGLNGISVSCSAHIEARLDIWPHPKCGFDLDGSVGSGSANAVVDVTSNAGHPAVSSKSLSVNVGDFKISFHGGICGFVADIIKDIVDVFFKSSVEHEVEKEIDSILTTVINDDMNGILASIPLDLPLPFKAPFDIASVDFALTDSPSFEPGYIGSDITGAVVNSKTKAPAPFPAPTIPNFANTSADHFLQLFLSPYVLESAVWTYQQAGALNFTIHHTSIPASFPVQLNTTDLAAIAPGIKTAFPNEWVDLTMVMPEGQKATVNATPGGVSVALPMQLEFNAVTPTGDKNAFVLACPFTGAMDLVAVVNSSTGNPMIAGNLTYLKCPLTLVSSNVGTVDAPVASGLVNLVFSDLITPLVNVLLNIGIPLPTIDGLRFTNFEIVNGNSYVLVASDFSYTPPAATSA